MTGPSVSCEVFDDGLDELALGLVDESERGRLLAHAAGCRRCQARLDDLVALGDRLLLVAPEVEPPAGFEGRALERMGVGQVAPAGRPGRAGRWLVAVAVAVAVVTLTAGIVIGRLSTSGQPSAVSRSGVIVSTSGADIGTVTLLSTPRPHILVSVPQPRTGPGVRTCELELADGRRVAVGTWTSDELSTGIWAVALDPALLDAVAMRVVGADGSILATAALT